MMRFGWMTTTCCAMICGGASALFSPAPKLIWNASASVPIGLYVMKPADALHLGELVVVRPPEAVASFLATRGYLGRGVPLLKRVLALPGQTVCRTGRAITVDGTTFGNALDHDRLGRALPDWQGCRMVANSEVFLMNWQATNSFDSRYFGALLASAIVGVAIPFWTEKDK